MLVGRCSWELSGRKQSQRKNPILGLGWTKSFEQHRQDKHFRGPSTPRTERFSPDKSVRRFAQDDDFVGVLKKNI
jgi:hypothetical protein